MDLHHYDPATGAYLATRTAREDPRNPGIVLLPAHATLIAPPEFAPGQWPVWQNGAWELAVDLRGTAYWLADGTPGTIEAVGEGLPAGASLTPPGPDAPAVLAAERRTMQVYRLAFEDAASVLPLGGGYLLGAIDGVLAALPEADRRRYLNITIFERWRPEVAAFLQNPGAIHLPDGAIDTLFRLAMGLEDGTAALLADPAIPGSAAARARTDQLVADWLASTGG
jgi:hypothetical protein